MDKSEYITAIETAQKQLSHYGMKNPKKATYKQYGGTDTVGLVFAVEVDTEKELRRLVEYMNDSDSVVIIVGDNYDGIFMPSKSYPKRRVRCWFNLMDKYNEEVKSGVAEEVIEKRVGGKTRTVAGKETRTNGFFIPGKISIILDGGAGSSGKGKMGAFIAANANNYQFVCNTFAPQASHWVYDREGEKSFCYKQFNSCAHKHENFEKMYIGQGAIISLKAFFEELKLTGIPSSKVGISPLTSIVQDIDRLYEEGKVGFDGKPSKSHKGTIEHGSTCSGVGATRARKVLRDKNIVLARDVEELKPFICDVEKEIMARLARGQSGLLEIAQGFQLSNGLSRFYPNCTSRNCTVAAALDDMMLPVTAVGNVCLNFRTFPIRIASKKYISRGESVDTQPVGSPEIAKYGDDLFDKEEKGGQVLITSKEGVHLTWDQVKSGLVPYDEVKSNSGGGYPDQKETTWDEVGDFCGANVDLTELTSLTKLPRRIFTFSKDNLRESILHNQTPNQIWISCNFCNYLDWDMSGVEDNVSKKVSEWIGINITPVISEFENVKLKLLGTGKYTEETIILS